MSLQPLYYASLLGLKRSVARLWYSCSQLDQPQGFYGNALNAAVCMGHSDVVMWLIDHIDYPPDYLDLRMIVFRSRLNVVQLLRVLLKKGFKTAIGPGVVFSMRTKHDGDKILRICLQEDLVTIFITKELIETATNEGPGYKIIDILVESRAREFPVDLRTLLSIAERSPSALQSLISSRKEDINIEAPEYLTLAQDKLLYYAIKMLVRVTETLLDLGVSIPVTTDLIHTLASSSSGSQILKLLLDKQTTKHLFTKSDVLTVAKGFHLETFESLLRYEWEDNNLTEELILAIAFNCYLAPPVGRWVHVCRSVQGGGLLRRAQRPTLRQSVQQDSCKALMSLMDKRELKIDLTERIVTRIAEEYSRDVILHLVNRLAGSPVCGSHASECDYHRFSSLLWTHASDIGVSPQLLRVLEESYKLMSTKPLSVEDRWVKIKAMLESKVDMDLPGWASYAAETLGLDALPEALRGFQYSSSEFDDCCAVYVAPGWRRPHDPEQRPRRQLTYRQLAKAWNQHPLVPGYPGSEIIQFTTRAGLLTKVVRRDHPL
ncbi:hypothetical protein KCU98_g17611, partial [Aureobasidium melanogenum]